MSRHLFAAIVTHHGTAANNRGETDGNVTTLQKLLWHGQVHTSVSAEAIRFALRRRLAISESVGTNRRWDEVERSTVWQDGKFKRSSTLPVACVDVSAFRNQKLGNLELIRGGSPM